MIRLFYNYYEDKNPARKREINMCLQRNLSNKFINTIIIESDQKLSYNYFFQQINKITTPDDINIICNSDIFFDDTIALASNIKEKEVYALTRWDWKNENSSIFFNRADSQDVWIVRGKVENVYGDFTLGIRGCDNRIAHEFHKAGYNVLNPSRSIKTYHVHNSAVRNYTFKDVVQPPYLTVEPYTL